MKITKYKTNTILASVLILGNIFAIQAHAIQPLNLSNLTMGEASQIYSNAVNAYNQQDYQTAYKYFKEYIKNNAMDKRGNFFYGRSAYEVGQYNDALMAYEKVLMEEPNNLRVQLETAQCYFKLKQYDKAKEIFNMVLQHDSVPPQVKQNIYATLQSIDQQNTDHFFRTMFMASYVYDTNVNNASGDKDFTVYFSGVPTVLPNDGEQPSDSSLQLVASLNHTYKIDDTMGLENTFTGYTQQYFHQHDKDIDLVSFGSSLAQYGKLYKASIGLGYDHVWLDNAQYVSTLSLKGEYSRKLNKQLNYQSYVKLSDKNYQQSADELKDAYVYELYNALSYNSKEFGISSLALTLGKEQRQSGDRTDVNKQYYGVALGNSYNISKNLLLKTSLEYKQYDYENMDLLFLSKRKDTQESVSVGMIQSINKNLSVGASVQYIDNQSNHQPFDYDKYISKVYLYYGF